MLAIVIFALSVCEIITFMLLNGFDWNLWPSKSRSMLWPTTPLHTSLDGFLWPKRWWKNVRIYLSQAIFHWSTNKAHTHTHSLTHVLARVTYTHTHTRTDAHTDSHTHTCSSVTMAIADNATCCISPKHHCAFYESR